MPDKISKNPAWITALRLLRGGSPGPLVGRSIDPAQVARPGPLSPVAEHIVTAATIGAEGEAICMAAARGA